MAAAAAAAAKKDQAKDKRAKDTPALVTTGSEVLKRLEQLGPNELLRLKIDELHSLLVNADPQASIPKPNKKTGQEKASLLPTIQAAFARFLAVAAAFAPQAPPQAPPPPILEAPLTCETENISINMSDDFFCLCLTQNLRMRQVPQQMLKFLLRTRKWRLSHLSKKTGPSY